MKSVSTYQTPKDRIKRALRENGQVADALFALLREMEHAANADIKAELVFIVRRDPAPQEFVGTFAGSVNVSIREDG